VPVSATLPKFGQEPVLGLRYESAKVKFDTLPKDVSAKCPEYSSTGAWGSHLVVYALVRNGVRTYYLVGGYHERRNPKPEEERYELDQRGGIFSIEGTQCIGYGQAREVFDARLFDETPQPILQQLAINHATTLARAFGGPNQLRAKLRNQNINADSLSPEVRDAFAPYFAH
jgi:hypothetical protein